MSHKEKSVKDKTKENLKKETEKIEKKVDGLKNISTSSTKKEKDQKGKKKVIYIIGGILGLFLLGFIALLFIPEEENNNRQVNTSSETSQNEINNIPTSYTNDQQKIIDEFGSPDYFKITQADNQRSELWYYIDLEEVFSFLNGAFIARDHHVYNVPENTTIYSLPFSPFEFYNTQTLDDAILLIGIDPTLEGEINPQVLENAKIANFDNLIIIGLINDKIAFVQTSAYADGIEIGKDLNNIKDEENDLRQNNVEIGIDNNLTEKDSDNKEQLNNKNDIITIIYSPDNIYYFDAGELAEEMTISAEPMDYLQFLYTICIPVENIDEADFFCEDFGTPVFNIASYTEEQFEEHMKTQFWIENTEEVIGEKDGLTYTIIHTEGLMPQNIVDDELEYIIDVIESFGFVE